MDSLNVEGRLLNECTDSTGSGIHMITPASSESELLKEEVSLLQTKVESLQQLVVELLRKNQQLREALEDRKRNARGLIDNSS